ncbi:LysR family transcriptional regulator [Ancylobacter sp. WKF20]|uniref:LysR family transcriptional regulator n=1 Tax=Ancylobacter sp. WKF20 TaxID=3039801 RepID=UPI0024346052|nr:LysR family transcriptional regulator [Ancylobacter sp. WKF20]WGD29655.1 LysR family transcriptional regulator [Ancylobacter sp. WKF20]
MSDHDLLSLKLFASAVELGNIAHAARTNNIAASAVSKRISDLEFGTGTMLLYRRRDGVEPTPAGQALYRRVRELCEVLNRLDAEVSEYSSGSKGLVRIFANTSSVTQFIPEDIADFLRGRPDVRIDLREEISTKNVEAVANGAADIAVFSGHVSHSGLETRIYRRDTLMIVAPKDHPLTASRSVQLVDTLQYDQVGLQEGSSIQSKVITEASVLGERARFRVHVLSFDAVRRMVEAGLGIAVLPQGAVYPYLDSMDIAAIELNEPWATRSLLLGYKDYISLPLVCRLLIEHLAPGV